eukprot:scaffold23911_cov127-Cylindrotheca_fusiformis.AAC.2
MDKRQRNIPSSSRGRNGFNSSSLDSNHIGVCDDIRTAIGDPNSVPRLESRGVSVRGMSPGTGSSRVPSGGTVSDSASPAPFGGSQSRNMSPTSHQRSHTLPQPTHIYGRQTASSLEDDEPYEQSPVADPRPRSAGRARPAARRGSNGHTASALSSGSSHRKKSSHSRSPKRRIRRAKATDEPPNDELEISSRPPVIGVREEDATGSSSAGFGSSAVASGFASRPTDVASSNEISQARRDANDLQGASKQKEVDGDYLRHLLELCRKDQQTLQVKLNNALENANGVENLEQLFSANDELVAAIDLGNDALKREKRKKQKQKVIDGPTIELLVQNEDVFSLICMLRAPTEKKLSAALALMQFAKENEMLRNEIRSSGGMHSFLTLYRGRNTGRDLRVVASLAVAYVLPSFVSKSQVSSQMAMKFLECLRFLVTTQPASPQNVPITRHEMYSAASAGVNALWIDTICPMIAVEKSKKASEVPMPMLEKQTSRFRRFQERSVHGMFARSQESKEIQDMTELSVTLITHIAKVASQEQIHTAYDIVEQVCAEDIARPIAVREGVLSTLVEWIRSKDLSQMRPSASALRYLISIEDQYNAGWIHSQVVNEGAVSEIVKLFNESVGNNVREAIAEMISALCLAAPTRAAVVESNCVMYLVSILYEHSSPSSEKMVHYAASALLQLAAGGIMQAGSSALSKRGSTVIDKQETVLK